MSIIERITQIMDTKNLNQSDLCKMLGIKDSTFSTWKTRGTDPPAKYILLICEYLGVSVDYLLGRTENQNGVTQVNTGDVGNHSNMNNSSKTELDEMSRELLNKFKELSFDDKLEVFNYIKNKKVS